MTSCVHAAPLDGEGRIEAGRANGVGHFMSLLRRHAEKDRDKSL